MKGGSRQGLVEAGRGSGPVVRVQKTGRGRAEYLASNFSLSPKALVGDPMVPDKSLDSRSEALRE